MRRIALAATILAIHPATLLAQSQVQNSPRTNPETATADGPLPNESDRTHPSTPNLAAPVPILPREREPILPIRPASPDTDQLTRHLRLSAGFGYGTISGRFLGSRPIGAGFGGSLFGTFELAFGISRQFELVAAGDYSDTSAGPSCANCGAKSWAIGPALRYHIVEGTRFDPWLAVGGAYRSISVDGSALLPGTSGSHTTVQAVDFLRLQLGADWFVTSQVALGPVFAFDLASSFSVPTSDSAEVFALYYAGFRLTFDAPGR